MPHHPEYEPEWEVAGYPKNMGSARACRPPPPELLRVYHLTSAEYAIMAVSMRRLKVARISELNDPFEFLGMNLKGEHRRQVMRDHKEKLDKSHGLLCFSENWTNPVLWSHYGARQRGIALGFNLRRSLVQPVNYDPERVRQALDDEKRSPRLKKEQEDLLRKTKFKHWEYEGEKRLFVELSKSTHEGSLYFRDFNDDLQLAEVILGTECNLSLDRVREVVSKLHKKAITFKARPGKKEFEIVRDEGSIP